jgi:hypothetical protein
LNDEQNNVSIYYIIHLFLYLVIVAIPWLFLLEMLPFNYAAITVLNEISLYILWSIIIILAVMYIRKDIKKLSIESDAGFSSKRMWNVSFYILQVLLFITLAFLVITLIVIGISFMD